MLWCGQQPRDRSREPFAVTVRRGYTAADLGDELTAAVVIANDHRRAADQCFGCHQPEDFIARRVDEHVRRGQRIESLAAGQQADAPDRCVDFKRADQPVDAATRSHVVACDD